jgi:hypothetical protein
VIPAEASLLTRTRQYSNTRATAGSVYGIAPRINSSVELESVEPQVDVVEPRGRGPQVARADRERLDAFALSFSAGGHESVPVSAAARPCRRLQEIAAVKKPIG